MIKLFQHQQEAIEAWLNAGKKGILSMATGTGKTFTALGALKHVAKESQNLLALISVPYAHLIPQWEKSFHKMGIPIYHILRAYSGNPNWVNTFKIAVRQIRNRSLKKLLIISTHDSLRNSAFLDINMLGDIPTMIIGDEVHGLGSTARKTALEKLDFKYRLGLSATPWRMWDDAGNEFLKTYFGDVVYEFPIERAVTEVNPITGKTYLTPYEYHPYFVFLTNEEMRRYAKLTASILRRISIKEANEDISNDDRLSMLLFKRAEIIKEAASKEKALFQILEDVVSRRGLKTHILVYVESRKQLDSACRHLKAKRISCYPFTMELSSRQEARLGNRSERDFILDRFTKGEIGALVSMKILDEGVDVPQARAGILMASTTSSRQYVQRIGRILRRAEGKDMAYVYDIIVLPNINASLPEIVYKIEKSILKREFARYMYIAKAAKNRFTVEREIYKYMDSLGVVLDGSNR